MKVKFLSKFNNDLDKVSSEALKKKLIKIIEDFESANNIFEINNIKKLKGDNISYRVRLGDYRIGIYYENNIVEFARFVHRKDIYKVFP
jgi:mRNA interferase RelE/StbE